MHLVHILCILCSESRMLPYPHSRFNENLWHMNCDTLAVFQFLLRQSGSLTN